MKIISEMIERLGVEVDTIDLDGEYHHLKDPVKGKKSIWYIGNEFSHGENDYQVVTYGNFRTGERYTSKSWVQDVLTKDQAKLVQQKAREYHEKVKKIEKEKRDKCVSETTSELSRATLISEHPYLKKKGLNLNAVKVHELKGTLLVPLYDMAGLSGVQQISETADKYFKFGTVMKGSIHPLGFTISNLPSTVYVAEGFATGLTLHLMLNVPVAVCFSCTNIENAIKTLQSSKPDLKIIICADNDHRKPFNSGLEIAKKVSQKFRNTCFIYPHFEVHESGSDFNDFYTSHGKENLLINLKSSIEGLNPITDGIGELDESGKPTYHQLALMYLYANNFLDSQKQLRLRFYKENYYVFEVNHYAKKSLQELENSILTWLNDFHPTQEKTNKRLINEIVLQLRALTSLPCNETPPFWVRGPQNVRDVELGMQRFVMQGSYNRNENSFLWVKKSHSPSFFNVGSLNYDFDPDAKCPEFMRVLSEILPEELSRDVLQEMFGYCLAPKFNMEKMFVLVGEGANGKSVILTILTCLLGEHLISNVGLENFNPARTFGLSPMIGKLANVVTELDMASSEKVSLLKAIISHEKIQIEEKFKNPFETIIETKLIFSTNSIPTFKDHTDGIIRRLCILPFRQQFLDEAKQDRRLRSASFWRDSGELPGILNWALEGLARLMLKHKFTQIADAAAVLGEYRKTLNPTLHFIEDELEAGTGFSEFSGTIYCKYQQYCGDAGMRPVSKASLTSEIKRTYKSVVQSTHPMKVNEWPHNNASKRDRKLIGVRLRLAQAHQGDGGSS